jgi:hypothetical protein
MNTEYNQFLYYLRITTIAHHRSSETLLMFYDWLWVRSSPTTIEHLCNNVAL